MDNNSPTDMPITLEDILDDFTPPGWGPWQTVDLAALCGGEEPVHTALRFPALDIPEDATIADATIIFHNDV